MKKTLTEYLKHIKDRRDKYWGKDEYLYRFYDAQYILLLDLICLGYDKEKGKDMKNCCEKWTNQVWLGTTFEGRYEFDKELSFCPECGSSLKSPVKEEFCECTFPENWSDQKTCRKCGKPVRPQEPKKFCYAPMKVKSGKIESLKPLDFIGKVLDNTTSIIIAKKGVAMNELKETIRLIEETLIWLIKETHRQNELNNYELDNWDRNRLKKAIEIINQSPLLALAKSYQDCVGFPKEKEKHLGHTLSKEYCPECSYNQALKECKIAHLKEVGELKKKIKTLMDGENTWWRERWIKKDYNQILEKKWKTAYECAENYQKMYEKAEAQLQVKKMLTEEEIYDKLDSVIYRQFSFRNKIMNDNDIRDLAKAITALIKGEK